MKKQLISMILIVLLAIQLVPEVIANNTYIAEAGNSYQITNVTESRITISMISEKKAEYDYVITNSEGVITSFGMNTSGDLTIPALSSVTITVKGQINISLTEGLEIDSSSLPALAIYSFAPRMSYVISSNDTVREIVTEKDSSARYDEVCYTSDGSISSYSPAYNPYESINRVYRATGNSEIYVCANGKTVISIGEEPIIAYMPYAWTEHVTVTNSEEPALATYTLESGTNYSVSSDGLSHNISTIKSTTSTYDEVCYTSDGSISSYSPAYNPYESVDRIYRQTTNSEIYVCANGKTVISIGDEPIIAYMPYAWAEHVVLSLSSQPALATYCLEAEKNYTISSIVSSYSINMEKSVNAVYDEVCYTSNGSISSYSPVYNPYQWFERIYKETGNNSIYVDGDGMTAISIGTEPIKLYVPYTWIDSISVLETGEPAFSEFTLLSEKQYSIVNSNLKKSLEILNNSESNRTYTYTKYDGNAKETESREDVSGSINVLKGGRTVLMVGDNDITVYIPSRLYKSSISIVGASGVALSAPTYPAINRQVSPDINVTYDSGVLEFYYDIPDPGSDVVLPIDELEKVIDSSTAGEAVNILAVSMTDEQKASATGTDLATLFAETAAARAASQPVAGKEIVINKANVEPLAKKAGSAVDAVDAALVSGGITTARYLANTVILTSTETGEIAIKIDPDILETEVDKVRVETPNYALTFKIADIEEDLTDIVTIKASSVGTTVSGGATARMGTVLMRTLAPTDKLTSVKLDVQNGKLRGPVTISLPDEDGDNSGDTTVSKDDGSAVSSKYNPATSTMDGKVTESGTYTVTTNSKDFTDIASKSQEMQTAIKYLASKGIINGTSETTFSPDGEITRAEVAALLVRSLGKLDSAAKSTFDDVKTSDWFYATAASSAKCGYIKGYDDNTFKGKNQILKQETVTVVSRVLQTEMGYKLPTDTTQYLSKYSDTLPNWAKPDIALATRENLIVYRVDGTFSGAKTITRGDAAIILYRMFQKIW